MLKIQNKLRTRNQKGLASIIVVAVLVVLMTLISIGFARLMSRSVANSTDNELSVAATDAAQSGINDTINLIEQRLKQKPTQDALEVNQCNTLSTEGINYNFATNEKYTCITGSTQVNQLTYPKIPANGSQVIEMTTTSPVDNLELSWESAADPHGNFPSSGTTSLLDETTWNKDNYAPLMEVSLYPITSSEITSPINDAILTAASRTYYLYPNGSNSQITPVGYSTASGTIIPTVCSVPSGSGTSVPGFGSSDYDCNMVISGMQAGAGSPEYFYLRLTPIYDAAAIQIQATAASGNAVKFTNVQADIDVTAQANTATKRLQAVVDLNSNSDNAGSNNLPDDGLRSAETICKHLQVESNGDVIVDGQTCNNQLNVTNPSPPAVTFCGDLSTNASCTGNSPTTPSIQDQQAVTLNWTVSGTAPVTCTTSTTDPAGWTSGPTGYSSGSSTSGTYTTGALSGGSSGNTDTYSITCTNAGGSSGTSTVTVTVAAAASSGCGSNCGGGSNNGGGGSNNPTINWTTPNLDSYVYSYPPNLAYCSISDNINPDNTGPFQVNAGGGSGSFAFDTSGATIATMTCYDGNFNPVGSDTISRNQGNGNGDGGGCAYYPVTDPFGDVIDCVGSSVFGCQFYQCYNCTNVNGTQVDCEPTGDGGCTDNGGTWDGDNNTCTFPGSGGEGTGPVIGCMNQEATNFNPEATEDDESLCTFPPPPSCPSGEDLSPNDGMCYTAGETDSWGCLDYGDGNWSC